MGEEESIDEQNNLMDIALNQGDEQLEQKDEKVEQNDQMKKQLEQKLKELEQKLKERDQQLKERDQKLKQKDEKLKQNDQKLKELDEKLKQRDEQLEQKDEKLKEIDQQLKEMDKRLNLLLWQSRSYVHVYNEFERKAKEVSELPIPNIQRLSSDQISAAWQVVKTITMPKLEDEFSIQSWFNETIPKLIKELGGQLTYFGQQKLSNPLLVPDGIICSPAISNPNTWEMLALVMEFKALGKETEGWGQSIGYLATMLYKQLIFHRTMGVGVFTDWTNIRFFIHNDAESFLTPSLPLFGKEKAQTLASNEMSPNATPMTILPNEPTEGFKKLCELLASSPSDLGYKDPPKSVCVDNADWKVVKTLGQGADSVAYACINPQSDEWVCVKVPIFFNHSQPCTFETESFHLDAIREKLSEENKWIIPRVVHCCANALVTSPVGTTLVDCTLTRSIKEILLLCLEWLNSLRILHEAGYVQNDVRPENAILVDKSVCLIDFQCPVKIGMQVNELRCAIPQLPRRWVNTILGGGLMPMAHPIDDLEQFVYGVSFLLQQEFKWFSNIDRTAKECENRLYAKVVQARQEYFTDPCTSHLERQLYSYLVDGQAKPSICGSHYEILSSIIRNSIDVNADEDLC